MSVSEQDPKINLNTVTEKPVIRWNVELIWGGKDKCRTGRSGPLTQHKTDLLSLNHYS